MSGARAWLLPREHGAWGMLLQPFAAAAILAGRWTPALPVALLAALAVFLMREPLLVLARQHWVWRERRPETPRAWRWLAAELAVAAAAGVYLFRTLPPLPLAMLGAAAAGMTLLSVWVALRNRQRAVPFQLAVAASLGANALLAALAATGAVPLWAWLLWALLTLHSAAAIFVVHARLAARTADARRAYRAAVRFDAVQLAIGAGVFFALGLFPASPLLFSTAVNAWELRRIGRTEPLTRVGFRTLGFSLAHTGLAIAVLWQSARA
jgi:hypothetical protein